MVGGEGRLRRAVVVAEFSGELVESGAGHGGVDAEEIPIPRGDDEAVAGPDDPGGGDDRLLGVGERLRRLGEVGDVGYAQPPLERRRPEMDRLRSRRVVPQSTQLLLHSSVCV